MNYNQLISSLNQPSEKDQASALHQIGQKEMRKYGYLLKVDHGA